MSSIFSWIPVLCICKLGVCGSAALPLSGRASLLATTAQMDIEQREEGEDGGGAFWTAQQVPTMSSASVVRPPVMHRSTPDLQPHGLLHCRPHVIRLQGSAATADGATVGLLLQNPMPISELLVRPPAMHWFLPELQPQSPVQSLAHRIDGQGLLRFLHGTLASSSAFVRPPRMHAFTPELQPQLPLQSSAHVIALQGSVNGAAVGGAVRQTPINSSELVVRPPV